MPGCKFRTLLLAAVLLAACNGPAGMLPEEIRGQAMGTTWSVTLGDVPVESDIERLRATIAAAIDDVDQSMSTYRADSELAVFNQYDGMDWFSVSKGFCRVVETALEISTQSSGAFDVTIGPVVDRWGFGPGPITIDLPTADELQELSAKTGFHRLEADCSRPALRKSLATLSLDLSGIAKGFAVDEVAAVLRANGLTDFLVEIGGELRSAGQHPAGRPWSVGIEDPARANGSANVVVPLVEQAVATSGGYRNYFEHEGLQYSHTIDPRTAAPVTHDVAAVTVIADSAILADAWATALLVLGPEQGGKLAEQLQLAACFQFHGSAGRRQVMTAAFENLLPAG